MPLAEHDAGGLLSAPIVEGNFNPRTPCGARPIMRWTMCKLQYFNPRAPLRGTTIRRFLTPPPDAAISIHVPLAGHDACSLLRGIDGRFQSTCPLRGTTTGTGTSAAQGALFQSTCPLRGTTRVCITSLMSLMMIFQSTCPLRGTTRKAQRRRAAHKRISIHVPLAGHDATAKSFPDVHTDFNPRAPCGARQWSARWSEAAVYFNPRAPCGARQERQPDRRRAPGISIHVPLAGHDDIGFVRAPRRSISIHVPLAGHDGDGRQIPARGHGFQSTCPLRGTTSKLRKCFNPCCISIHVPLAGHDTIWLRESPPPEDFNPRAPCGARPMYCAS